MSANVKRRCEPSPPLEESSGRARSQARARRTRAPSSRLDVVAGNRDQHDRESAAPGIDRGPDCYADRGSTLTSSRIRRGRSPVSAVAFRVVRREVQAGDVPVEAVVAVPHDVPGRPIPQVAGRRPFPAAADRMPLPARRRRWPLPRGRRRAAAIQPFEYVGGQTACSRSCDSSPSTVWAERPAPRRSAPIAVEMRRVTPGSSHAASPAANGFCDGTIRQGMREQVVARDAREVTLGFRIQVDPVGLVLLLLRERGRQIRDLDLGGPAAHPYDVAVDGRFLALAQPSPPPRVRVGLGWDREVTRVTDGQ